jgi:hypothetical protein
MFRSAVEFARAAAPAMFASPIFFVGATPGVSMAVGRALSPTLCEVFAHTSSDARVCSVSFFSLAGNHAFSVTFCAHDQSSVNFA